jgi:hypothetical protein
MEEVVSSEEKGIGKCSDELNQIGLAARASLFERAVVHPPTDAISSDAGR